MTIDTPEVLDVPAQKTARIQLVIPSSEAMTYMIPGLTEIRQSLSDQGVPESGSWLTHHFKMPGQTFDFEICIPVDKVVSPQGRVEPGELRATKVVRTIYRGDYGGLGGGWGEFIDWIKAQNLTMAGDFWEVYSVGPNESINPADWQTELNCPLV